MERIEIRDMKPEDELYVGSCTHLNDPGYNLELARSHVERLRNAYTDNGLRIKVALLSGKQVGFAHIYPIETCPSGPLGKDLSVVFCINVAPEKRTKNGIGSNLLRAAEEESRAQHRKGMVIQAYYSDFWLMPARFFERCGYTLVQGPRQVPHKGMDKYVSDEALLWKVFDQSAEPPRFLERIYRFNPIPGKVVIDLFYTISCHLNDREIVRSVCRRFGDQVILNEYNADNPEILRKNQIHRGLFINGREIEWGGRVNKKLIYETIETEL